MSFPDEETFLPIFDHYRLNALLDKAAIYTDSYNAAHAHMVNDGWIFEDKLGAGLGSDEKLIENATDYYGPDFFTAYWNFPTWADYWLLPVPNHVRTPIAQVYEHYFQEINILWNDAAWMSAPMGVPGLLSAEGRFKTGVAVRQATRFVQHRVAKCIEMVFCLDNRGRPRLE